jgi:putative transposase
VNPGPNSTPGGSLKGGKRPYFTYEGVTYRNAVYSRKLNMIGKELNLVVNINDLRVMRGNKIVMKLGGFYE